MLRVFGYIIVVSVVGTRKGNSSGGLTSLGIVFLEPRKSEDNVVIGKRSNEYNYSFFKIVANTEINSGVVFYYSFFL